jgi:hypothetical protein
MAHCAICGAKENLHFEKGQWLCDDCRSAKEIDERRRFFEDERRFTLRKLSIP